MLKEKVSWSIIKFSWEFLKGNINVSFSFSFNSLPSFLSFLLMLQAIALNLKAVSWSPKEFEERERESERTNKISYEFSKEFSQHLSHNLCWIPAHAVLDVTD